MKHALTLSFALLSACAVADEADESAGSSETGDTATTGEPAVVDDLDRSPVAHVCAPGEAASDAFADCVESFRPGDASFGHDMLPDVVLGPPRGGGKASGGLDVASLGCDGVITLHFDDPALVDGPGPDLIVFENAFDSGSSNFIEPARVLVSADGVDWRAFPCDPAQAVPRGCAGLTPVLSSPANGVDPTDPAVAGGDAFDLADVGLTRARYVRIVDVGLAHFGQDTWCGGAGGGFDLDAVAAVPRG
ncbi:MAG: cell surface protein [Myxococcales bacterium]|nr:cell surface protein [Myxococcales bacterium]